MVDAEYEDFPKLPGVNLHELVAGVRQLVDPDISRLHFKDLLDDYVVSVMPFLGYEYHLSHGPALYCLIRLTEPNLVVETGVREGESTVSVLAAMGRNRRGTLISCDVDLPTARVFRFLTPADDQPRLGHLAGVLSKLDTPHADAFSPKMRLPAVGFGWAFRQCKGVDLLRELRDDLQQRKLGTVPADIFFHDSDHSYANQAAEYALAWDLVRPGGWVGGDDVEWDKQPWAFYELCAAKGLKPSFFGKGRMVHKPEA